MQDWPLREVLLRYLALKRRELTETYKHAQLCYQLRAVFGSTEKPPEIPAMLREADK